MDRVITPQTDGYPKRLSGLKDAPSALYWRGPIDESPLPIAVVGARAATGHALERAALLADAIVSGGGTVYSGGAIGVDAAAHRAALRSRGRTVAVLASGFDHLYPARHKPLFGHILAEGGALVSRHEPTVAPRRYQFVVRNRLLARLCDAVVVVEADRASGSLYTARAAIAAGRRLFAMPGSPGCEALIAQGATPLADPGSIVSAMTSATAPTLAALAPRDAAVLELLGDTPRSAEELAGACGLEARDVDRALAALEMSRFALAMPGRSYVRSALGEAVRS